MWRYVTRVEAPKRSYPEPLPGMPDPNEQATPQDAELVDLTNKAILEEASTSAGRKRKRTSSTNYKIGDEDRLKVSTCQTVVTFKHKLID